MKFATERRLPTLLIMLIAIAGIALAVAIGSTLLPLPATGWSPGDAAQAEPHS